MDGVGRFVGDSCNYWYFVVFKMKSWKALEAKVAKEFNTTRNPLSGGSGKHSRSDTLHQDLFLECKQRASFHIVSMFREVQQLAREEHKEPVLICKEKGKHGEVAVVDLKFLLKLWNSKGG